MTTTEVNQKLWWQKRPPLRDQVKPRNADSGLKQVASRTGEPGVACGLSAGWDGLTELLPAVVLPDSRPTAARTLLRPDDGPSCHPNPCPGEHPSVPRITLFRGTHPSPPSPLTHLVSLPHPATAPETATSIGLAEHRLQRRKLNPPTTNSRPQEQRPLSSLVR
ncbi:hypothetical protein PtA15_9A315 [Puccinia triticina]|uniref:Uncharacterized protein n=1 Tax=Puccinia triticina TaxID=208348 RepID=A0ABY7CWP5_9BASI|nr:uncharacterized protein PtA15_9A315 [Puccinia triticina]WAQ88190.1 hypothetical protein PtA15_9A315 [Puccinia triticina]